MKITKKAFKTSRYSLAIVIPSFISKLLNIKRSDEVEMWVDEDIIKIQKKEVKEQYDK